MYYIQCVQDESDEPIELPLEADYTMALSTLTAQYPGCTGLKYRSETGGWRGLKVTDGKVHQADGNWGSGVIYVAVYPKGSTENKRKAEDSDSDIAAKAKKYEMSRPRCTDLIVLGLPWKTDEDDLKVFFGQFGEVALAQIKRDPKTSQSKGYGFIRFKDYDAQQKAISQRHCIDGRWCDVRIPNSKGGEQAVTQYSRKIFVGRVSEEISKQDLKDYFSKFGEVTDVFIPIPHRAFAFVTFVDHNVAMDLYEAGEDHIIKGCSCNISNATVKNPDRPDRNGAIQFQSAGAGNSNGPSGDYSYGYGYTSGPSPYGANDSNGSRNQFNGANAGGSGGGGGGNNSGMDMSNMMNPAMMQSMMQMMMMSGMMGAMSGAANNQNNSSGGDNSNGMKRDTASGASYGYGGWGNTNDNKSGGGFGSGYGSGWGSSGWGK